MMQTPESDKGVMKASKIKSGIIHKFLFGLTSLARY
jgi:hypothetical protein